MSWPHERWVGPYELKGHRVDAYLGSSWKARRSADGPWVRVRVLDTAWIAQDAVRDALCEGAFWEMELAHPNIAQVIDLVVERDQLALVSHFTPGKDLVSLLEITRQARLAIPQGVLLRIADDLLAGLCALEAAARDVPELGGLAGGLHPDCIHVALDGHARLTDVTASAILSRAGVAAHTPLRASYCAPEHDARLEADARTDLFVLGSLMWEALARRRLDRSDLQKALASTENELAPWIKRQAPFRGEPIPSALAEIIACMLQPDPGLRPTGYRALREAFVETQLALASRGEVAAFLQSLPGAGGSGERAEDAPSAKRRHAFDERSTAETPILLPDATVPELRISELLVPEPETQSVALVHVVTHSRAAPPPVVITNQPPREVGATRRRVTVALVAASLLAAAVALALMPRGSRSDSDVHDGAAVEREQAAMPPPSLVEPPRSAGAAPLQDTTSSIDLAVAPDAGAAAMPHTTPVRPRPANPRKPDKPHAFTPTDI